MKDRYFIEWDKDDIDTLRMMKVDVLALGMLTCIRKAFDLMAVHSGVKLDLAGVPREEGRRHAGRLGEALAPARVRRERVREPRTERHEARLEALRLADGHEGLVEINVGECERQRLPDPHPRAVQE